MKKIICVLMALSIAWCLCACEEISEPTQTPTPTPTPIPKATEGHCGIWTDEETGVQYIVYHYYKGCGITPRLNADGTLYHPTEKDGGEE